MEILSKLLHSISIRVRTFRLSTSIISFCYAQLSASQYAPVNRQSVSGSEWVRSLLLLLRSFVRSFIARIFRNLFVFRPLLLIIHFNGRFHLLRAFLAGILFCFGGLRWVYVCLGNGGIQENYVNLYNIQYKSSRQMLKKIKDDYQSIAPLLTNWSKLDRTSVGPLSCTENSLITPIVNHLNDSRNVSFALCVGSPSSSSTTTSFRLNGRAMTH